MKLHHLLLSVLVLGMLVISSSVMIAQAPCTIDLNDPLNKMFEAQRLADRGDTDGALALIGEVQVALASIADACQPTASAGGFELTQVYRTESEGQPFSIEYPAGWTPVEQFGSVFFASDPDFVDAINDDPNSLPAGEFAVGVVVMPIDNAFSTTFNDFYEEIAENNDTFRTLSTPEVVLVGGRDARRITGVTTGGIFVYFDFIDFSDIESPSLVLIAGLAHESDKDRIAALVPAMEDTITPRLVAQPVPTMSAVTDAPDLPAPTGLEFEALEYASLTPLEDLNEDIFTTNAALSPDGTRIGYVTPQNAACHYVIESGENLCAEIPDEGSVRPFTVQWSPDSAYIAFTNDFFITLQEPDLFIYDVAANSVTNITNDGVIRFRPGDSANANANLDIMATWAPDGALYLYRARTDSEGGFAASSHGIFRVSADFSTIEEVKDLTGLIEPVSVIYRRETFLDGTMTVSPDGSRIAMIVQGRQIQSPDNGVYVLDLPGGELTQVATFADLALGLPSDALPDDIEWQLFAAGLSWEPTGQGLYIYAYRPDFMINASQVVYHDLTAKTFTPLFDFSAYTNPEMFSTPANGDLSPALLVPVFVAPTPRRDGVIVAGSFLEEVVINKVRVVDGAVEVVTVLRAGDDSYGGSRGLIQSVSKDGSVILNAHLMRVGQ